MSVASVLPLQGPPREQGEEIEYAIRLALEQRGGMAGEVRVDYVSLDNATAQAGDWDEAKCTYNARQVAQREEIVSLIGPLHRGCAEVQIPILNEAGVPMIDPAVTYDGFTRRVGPDEPERYYPAGERNYLRVIPADYAQARAGAAWMRDEGVGSVYVLDDRRTYGRVLVEEFRKEAVDLGIEVLGREGIDDLAPDYDLLMDRISGMDPDAIYYGGVARSGVDRILRDKVEAGMSNEEVLFFSAQGMYRGGFLELAGEAAEGIHLTVATLPGSGLSTKGAEFVEAYRNEYRTDLEPYTAYGYEAAGVMLDAIERAHETDGEVSRESVRKALFSTEDYEGVLGVWSFDRNGDTTLNKVSGYKVVDGSFRFVRVVEAAGGE